MVWTVYRAWIALVVATVALVALASALQKDYFRALFAPRANTVESKLANACVLPENATDEIFFISCGGIY